MRILVDSRWFGSSGIGRYAEEILNRASEDIQIDLLQNRWKISNPLTPIMLGSSVRKSNADIFWSPGFMPPHMPRKPSVITMHDLIHLHYGTSFHKSYYNHVIKRLIRECRFILTDSDYSRNEIISWSGISENKVVKIPLGVSEEFNIFGEKYNPGYPYVLYVGNRRRYKNLSRLVAAFCMASKGESTKLIFTGQKDQALTEIADRFECADQIEFIGVLDDSKLSSLYRGASIVVYPSLYEGFGLPPLEAMACGAPVICSNVTSVPEIVGEAAILINPLDTDEMANAIKRVIGDSILREELIKRGITHAKQYTWNNTAKLTWKILKSVKDD
jgi:glycosyltransferase involved in cell wall biosynthesis